MNEIVSTAHSKATNPDWDRNQVRETIRQKILTQYTTDAGRAMFGADLQGVTAQQAAVELR